MKGARGGSPEGTLGGPVGETPNVSAPDSDETAAGSTQAPTTGRGERVLITGGAGFLGINLTRYLLARGFEISSLDLAPFDYPDCRDKVRKITGDIRNRSDVDGAMEDVDLVVHTAAALPLYTPEDIFSTDGHASVR